MMNMLQKLIGKVMSKPGRVAPFFDKEALTEIKLIRLRLKEEFGEMPDLQDPLLLEEFIDCAFISQDAISRSHIRKLMNSLGEPWASLYQESNQRRIDKCDSLK